MKRCVLLTIALLFLGIVGCTPDQSSNDRVRDEWTSLYNEAGHSANFEFAKGKLQDALNLAQRELPIPSPELAMSYGGLAFVESKLGNTVRADSLFLLAIETYESLDVIDSLDYPRFSQDLANAGMHFYRMEAFDKAVTYLSRSIDTRLRWSPDDVRPLVLAHQSLGRALGDFGYVDSALVVFRSGIELCRESNSLNTSPCLDMRAATAQVLLRQQRIDEATEIIEDLLSLKQSLGRELELSTDYLMYLKVRLEIARGNHDHALETIDSVLSSQGVYSASGADTRDQIELFISQSYALEEMGLVDSAAAVLGGLLHNESIRTVFSPTLIMTHKLELSELERQLGNMHDASELRDEVGKFIISESIAHLSFLNSYFVESVDALVAEDMTDSAWALYRIGLTKLTEYADSSSSIVRTYKSEMTEIFGE